MATTRALLLVLLLLATRSFITEGLIIKGIHDAVKGPTAAVVNTAVKIPVVGGVVGVAVGVGRHIGEKVDDTIQAGADAVAPATPCYEPLGCFPMEGPWWSIDRLVPTPDKPEEIDTKFYLYTRAHPERYYIQTRPNVSVDESDFDGSRRTIIMTHGFASNGNTSWLEEMKDAVLSNVDANVIIVDWGKGASKLNYFKVTANTRVVGAEIARVCLYLMKNRSMSQSKLHLVGHSLGAHIMSYVSRNVSKISRITGLDPAQPLFENFPSEVLLDSSDAAFVDIIHTDAESFIPFFGFGVVNPYGDVDFYINGGKNQPGCRLTDLIKPNITSVTQLATILVEAISDYIGCPHGRSFEVWISSLAYDNCTFLGTLEHESNKGGTNNESRGILDKIIPLGLSTILYPARGSFYVKTTGIKPYCIEDTEKEEKFFNAARGINDE